MQSIHSLIINQIHSFVFAVFGLIGSAAGTYTAVMELATTHFTAPCYVQPFLQNVTSKPPESHLNCCGVWQNVTRLGDISECNPYRDYYSQH